jgi:hypothetical protein
MRLALVACMLAAPALAFVTPARLPSGSVARYGTARSHVFTHVYVSES